MKILVGLLVTIENEYDQCINSILEQSYKKYSIYEIRDKPKNTAHDLLYSYFMNNNKEYDLMIHIGPDMVIESNTLFEDIIKEFETKKTLDRLFIPCYDHFVGENLGGVNVYRNTVKWNMNEDNLFTDRGHIEDTIRETRKWNPTVDKPLIHHCPNPSPYQAFHFGLHRMIKVVQPGVGFQKATIRKNNWYMFQTIIGRYKKIKTNNLLYALAGADATLRYSLSDKHISYGNKEVLNIFYNYDRSIKSNDELKLICGRLIDVLRYPKPLDYWLIFLRYRFKSK